MWNFSYKLILRNRVFHLITIGLLTLFFGFHARKVQLSYEYAQMLPENHPEYLRYEQFRKVFPEEANILFIAAQTNRLNDLDFFIEWKALVENLQQTKGVKEVFALPSILTLHKDTALRKFQLQKLFEQIPSTQKQYDSLLQIALKLKFYDRLLFSIQSNVHVILVWIDNDVLNTEERISVVHEIEQKIYDFSKTHQVTFSFSGLPYIRTIISERIKDELFVFVFAALVICMIILWLFFRSVRAIILPLLVVMIGVVWSLGLLVLLGYKITVLTGILPPLLIIIGIENCIYLLTRYHREIQEHGGVGRALTRVIQKVGYATLLTNATTAVGFGAFVITGNDILVEFGVVAFISILFMFLISITLIPILYSFFKPPKERHIKHLQKRWITSLYNFALHTIQYKQKIVFAVALMVFMVGLVGIFLLEKKGSMVDDIPQEDRMYADLLFFEEHFGGVLPFEIMIDTRKKKGLTLLTNIRNINDFQNALTNHPYTGKPLSFIEFIKFAKQAFYNNNPRMYDIPSNHERNFIFSYIPNLDNIEKSELLNAFTDTSLQIARVSLRIKNINTVQMAEFKNYVKQLADSLLPSDTYDVTITGTSVVFLKGSEYLVRNLIWSLLFATIVIFLLMFMLFNSFRMVIAAIIPNILPLLATAGLMGFFKIDIKPSTIIIYSISLGISVDATIHLLSRYRQQLNMTCWNVQKSIVNALKDTIFGMVYSGIVLVSGFSVFITSSFGGTQSLGFLVAFTLLVAIFSNLLFLPSIIMFYNNKLTTKAFARPMVEFLDTEQDAADMDIDSSIDEIE